MKGCGTDYNSILSCFLKLSDHAGTICPQRQEGPVNEAALVDCAATIRREHRLAETTSPEGLLALRDALRRNT